MNKYLLIMIIFLLLIIGSISAIKLTTFNGNSIPLTIDFGNKRQQNYSISLFRSANVTSAYINLSGYSSNSNSSTLESYSDSYNFYWYTGGVLGGPLSLAMTFEYQKLSSYNVNKIQIPISCDAGNNIEMINFSFYITNSSGQPETMIASNYSVNGSLISCVGFTLTNFTFPDMNLSQGYNYSIVLGNPSGNNRMYMQGHAPNTYSTGGIYWLNDSFYWNSYNAAFFFTLFSSSSYPENISVDIGVNNIWNHTSVFSNINNKTSDFSTILNNSLNQGACDCASCSLNENSCTINFSFYSTSIGLLEVSELNIDWSDHELPNLTLYHPNQTYNGLTYIPLNFTAYDTWQLETCYYNITRGASLEIANTNINCSQNTTFTVSGDASYIIWMCINDTSGNNNCTSNSFKTTNYVAPPVAPPAPGGGGGTIVQIINALTTNVTANICKPTYPALSTSWIDFKKELSWTSFKKLWYSYWDYSLCNSAASIIPLD